MFKKGDKIEILKEFQDKGDDKFEWVCLNDEELGRIDIQPININLTIKPVYCVYIAWIKHKE